MDAMNLRESKQWRADCSVSKSVRTIASNTLDICYWVETENYSNNSVRLGDRSTAVLQAQALGAETDLSRAYRSHFEPAQVFDAPC